MNRMKLLGLGVAAALLLVVSVVVTACGTTASASREAPSFVEVGAVYELSHPNPDLGTIVVEVTDIRDDGWMEVEVRNAFAHFSSEPERMWVNMNAVTFISKSKIPNRQ